MKPVDQTIISSTLGDCFRACVASIFEFPIEQMPNFWEQTQNGEEFWKLSNDWLVKNKGYHCITVQFEPKDLHLTDGILCIACARSPRGDTDHAVVWKNGLLHDPHPSRLGLIENPDTFTLFLPSDPKETYGK